MSNRMVEKRENRLADEEAIRETKEKVTLHTTEAVPAVTRTGGAVHPTVRITVLREKE